MSESCLECRFFIKGSCRRMCPAASRGTPWGHWPFVQPEDWCGEFQRKAAPLGLQGYAYGGPECRAEPLDDDGA